MKRFVVDASVAIKWYLPEALAEQADRFLEEAAAAGSRLLAPDLIVAELGNIIWKKHRLKELSVQDARQILAQILDVFPVQICSSMPLLEPAWEIAQVYERSVYDALYVALAERSDAVLVTADRKLVNAFKRTPLAKRTQWLGDWGS